MIRIEKLSRRFAQTRAVREVSLEIPAHTTLCLVGRSGSGKTTLLRLVNRLLEPTGGRVFVEGRPTDELDVVSLRRQMGYVIQGGALFPHLTVEENVALVPNTLGWSDTRTSARVQELLDWVGLEPDQFGRRWPHQLSGGQQQRVGIARALAGDPPIILMDEPFGALDPATRSDLQVEQLRLRDELGKTTILVTHDLTEAIRLGDAIGVLDEGRLVQWCSPEELLADQSHPSVVRLTEAAGVAGPGLLARDLMGPVGRQRPRRESIPPDLPLAATLELLFATSERAIPVVVDGEWVGTITPESLIESLQ